MMFAASTSSLLGSSWSDLGTLAISALGIYVAVLVIVRINGLRSFSKMSSVDFVVTIAVGSIVASVAATTTSLASGVVAVVVLFGAQFVATTLRRHDRGVLDNHPEVLMIGAQPLHDVMARRRVTVGDIQGKLREADAISLDDVICVVLEATGDVSVVTRRSGEEIDPWVLENVAGGDAVLAREAARRATPN